MSTALQEITLWTASDGADEAIQLNATWRVLWTDQLQWILQRYTTLRWRDRSFCRKRDTLLRCIREYCGTVDPKALAIIAAWPAWGEDRKT